MTSYKRRHHDDASSALQQQCENERKVICRHTALLLDTLLLNDRKHPKMRIPTQLIVRDAVDRKCYVQHSVMRATKTTHSTDHALSIGFMSVECQHCRAQKFQKEHIGMCCANGKVVLPLLPAAPEPLASLLAGTHDDSKDDERHAV